MGIKVGLVDLLRGTKEDDATSGDEDIVMGKFGREISGDGRLIGECGIGMTGV